MSLVIEEGMIFNNLAIINEVNRVSKGKRRFLCRCVCGNTKEVNLIHLTTNRTKSCGCLNRNKHQTRENNPSWKGGKRMESGGYVEIYMPEHPNARSNGYVKEHRLVMESFLGRYLYTFENVHHINGIISDNRIENLELWSTSQPCGQRVSDKLKWAKEIIELYG